MKKRIITILVLWLLSSFLYIKQANAITLTTTDVDYINTQVSSISQKINDRLFSYKTYVIKQLYTTNIVPTQTEKNNTIWTYIIGILQKKYGLNIYDISLSCNYTATTNLVWCEATSHAATTVTTSTISTTTTAKRMLTVPWTITTTTTSTYTPIISPIVAQVHSSATTNLNLLDTEIKRIDSENATIKIGEIDHKVILSNYACNTLKPTTISSDYFYFSTTLSGKRYYCHSQPNKFYIQGITTIDLDWFRKELTTLINNLRATNKISTLQLDTNLNTISQNYSTYMFNNLYFDHSDKNGNDVQDRLNSAGYRYTYYGENLAKGVYTAKQAFEERSNSSSHRTNMLNPNFNSVWFGRDGTYVDATFAKK